MYSTMYSSTVMYHWYCVVQYHWYCDVQYNNQVVTLIYWLMFDLVQIVGSYWLGVRSEWCCRGLSRWVQHEI
jgi:hypothetical protein